MGPPVLLLLEALVDVLLDALLELLLEALLLDPPGIQTPQALRQ
jgi:hypothetical protein